MAEGQREIIDLVQDEPEIIEISDSENETNSSKKVSETPSYYQRAFISILSTVIEVYSIILSPPELSILNLIIIGLSISAQRLFIRLILRKVGWHRSKKLIYDDISNINEAIEELSSKSLCIIESDDLMDYLNLLTIPEMKTIVNLKLFLKTVLNQREDLIRLILEAKSSGQQRISFSKDKMIVSSRKNDKIEIIRQETGQILKISDQIRQLIETAISLYFLVSPSQENLSTAILVEINRKSYPKYKIIRETPIFKCRNDFLEYQRALEMEILIKENEEDEEKVIESLDEIIRNFQTCLQSCDMERSYFLRRYTAGWVYCRILSEMASALETLKKYQEAVDIYKILLNQEIYCCGYRGKWWERIVLDTSKHLKNQNEALILCESALNDSWLRTSALTSIKRRQKKLKKSDDDLSLNFFEDEPEIITIKGRIQGGNVTGKKVKLHLDGDDLSLGSVEEFVLNEFSRDGWEGVHSESSCFTTLFTLLFWDLLFDLEVPDVFQTAYQTAPLDLNTDAFYPARTVVLEERLKLIETDFEAAIKLLQKHHVKNHLVSSIGVNWTDYSGEEGIALLTTVARGIGGMALSLILRQFCEDYRHNRSGMPDLILWRRSDCPNSSELIDHANGLIFAEVKSPNDRLSDGQRHWFSVLKNGGLRVVLVRVSNEQEQQKRETEQDKDQDKERGSNFRKRK